MSTRYDQEVGSRYHIYNSLFLNLPFQIISRTGTLLPLLQHCCEKGFEAGESATDIINKFFSDFVPQASQQEQIDLLFGFIQYVERQVALFDSIEDAAFERLHDLQGRGSISALLMRTEFENKTDKFKSLLDNFSLRIVLTAHPTQFYPGPVLGILTDLEHSIRENELNQINLLLQQLGKTNFINQEKPTPFDEAVSLCWYLKNVFYTAIPAIISKIAAGTEVELKDWNNNRLIVIGFWPGGDRDGNPFVTTEITMKVINRLQKTIFQCYYHDIRQLQRRITFKGVDKLIDEIERKIYLRSFGNQMLYSNAQELLDDLLEAREIIVQQHGGLFVEMLDDLLLKVKLFGFHFATLDLRQDSRKIDQVWDSIFDASHTLNKSISKADFDRLPESDQITALLSFSADIASLPVDDEFARETINSIKAIKDIQSTNGHDGCHRYIISNNQKAVHVIKVYALAKNLFGGGKELPVDIVPLFETINDLAQAPAIMESLYAVSEYRDHIQHRDNRQTMMLGFSDGTKDGGYLRANWSIYRAKENLTAVSRQQGVEAVFFDGRGGPPARGGGNTHDFYASLGDAIESKEVQITVQGQTISSKFGRTASCEYNLEQLLSAGLENNLFDQSDNQLNEDEHALMEELAGYGYQSYLKLKKHDKFIPYLEKVTPLQFYGESNIGSRPSKRGGSSQLSFEDLRAIPFVGAWAQMKQNIPGFYGVGSALQLMHEKGSLDEFKDLYGKSLFFRTLINNSMMALSKSYYQATAYLKNDEEFGQFWRMIYDEYNLSKKMVLDISGFPHLAINTPNTHASVTMRERIVLPVTAIQQYALMQLRYGAEADKSLEPRYKKLVMRAMFGIINAARNSA